MAQRRRLIAGNWKMHNGISATTALLEGLLQADLPKSVDIVVCPPFTSLAAAAVALSASTIGLGAQNVHWENKGAFTAEISPDMLSGLGVGWTIVGHSERRSLFGETDATAAMRAVGAQKAGLEVIFCLGESLGERESGSTFKVLKRQVSVLKDLDPAHLVLAYEPVWAIGTGKTATAEQADEAHAFLRSEVSAFFGSEAQTLRILYGGSMKPANAAELLGRKNVDGGLIGGASLDVDSFSAIIRAAAL